MQVAAWRSVGVKRGSAGKRCKCDEDVDEDAKDGVKIKKRLITEAHEKRAHAMVSLTFTVSFTCCCTGRKQQ